MQGRTLITATLLACALLGAGHWLGTQRQQATLQGLQQRLATAERRLARLEARPAGNTPLRAGASANAAAAADPVPLMQASMPAPATADLPRLAQERRSTLESTFRAQSIDAAWAAGTERSLLRAAAAPELGLVQNPPTQVQAECRRSACRVQARFDDPVELETWLQGYLLVSVDAIARSEAVQERDASGRTVLTIYGARR